MTKPRDPETIRAQLLDAATASYTGGGAFSVREIAAAAGVNHGQIHHVFGGKDGLKGAMLEHLGRSMLKQLRGDEPADAASMVQAVARAFLADDGRFARALARQILESPTGDITQAHFPVVSELLTAIDGLDAAARPAAQLMLAEGLAKGLGWALFAPWIRKATRIDDAVATQVEARLSKLPSQVPQ